MSIRQRLRSFLWRVPVEQEVRDEIAHHVELRTRELVDRGVDPVQARREALGRFGNVSEVQARLTQLGEERNRSYARQDWWDEFQQDVRFALRQSARQPGFTAAAVLTLALGLGATTAIFSVVYAVILRPLPFADPSRTVMIFTQWKQGLGGLAVGNFEYIRQRTTTLEGIAGIQYVTFNLTDQGTPERLVAAKTTWNLHNVFGVRPLYGRTYTKDEDRPGGPHVVVLSERFWTRRYGGDPSVLGRQLPLNNEPYDIIGILPARFNEITGATVDVYVPIAFTAERLAFHDEHYLEVYGLRRADATVAQVEQDLARTAEALRHDFPKDASQIAFAARDVREYLVGDFRLRLYVLLGAVSLVLVIGCINVANLLIARLAARSRELAIRAAIGASRGRIVRQVLTESLVVAGIGGLAGLLLAWWALPTLVANAPDGIPRIASTTLDSTVVAAALALVIVSAVIVGLLPAWQATRRHDLRDELGEGKGAGSQGLRPWVRQALIASQAALVMIVLAAAALLVRSAVNLQRTPVGFDPSGILTARLTLPATQYKSPAALQVSFNRVLEEVSSAPGVEHAALDSRPPLVGGGGGSNGLLPEGKELRRENLIDSTSHFVSADYFKVLRIQLRAGRGFTPQDVRRAPLVMIVNETLARRAFGDVNNAMGKHISCCEGSPEDPMWKTIVGVAPDVRTRGPGATIAPEFYLPIAQVPDAMWTWTQNSLSLVARSKTGDPAALAGAIRNAVRELDPTVPVYRLRTMEEGLQQSMAQARFNTALMLLLGLTGLVLAALGIYGVIAWLVAQRTREIGLRMALGASAGGVIRKMTWDGLKPVAVGLAVGVAGALLTGRWLQGQLYEVGPRDPIAITTVAALMLLVAAAAALIPAWRASSIDPSRALHDA
jgi:putative ABC transport system permease protein